MAKTDQVELTASERNLDRAVNLAANGRIPAEKVVSMAKLLDAHLNE